MKKLEEIKEALAKEKGYETWTKCINDHPNCMVETLMDIVALRLYSVSQCNELLKAKEGLSFKDLVKIVKDGDDTEYIYKKTMYYSDEIVGLLEDELGIDN